MNKILNLLGLVTRAGKLITGEDLLLKAIKEKKVKLIIIATDCGKNTQKKLLDKSKYYGIEAIEIFTIEQISRAIGKENRVAIGIEDVGFSKKLKELMTIGGYINNEKN